jgi:hypothetical protein
MVLQHHTNCSISNADMVLCGRASAQLMQPELHINQCSWPNCVRSTPYALSATSPMEGQMTMLLALRTHAGQLSRMFAAVSM